MIFALAGNQNCGKTTLFNQLTGSNQHVGNFPGVTVEQKARTIIGTRKPASSICPACIPSPPTSARRSWPATFCWGKSRTGLSTSPMPPISNAICI